MNGLVNGGGRGRGRRRWLTVLVALVTGASPVLVPVAAVPAGVAVVSVASAGPARASGSGSVLILGSSVNGGTSSAEAQAAVSLGLSVTVATDSQWPTENFSAFNAVIIGDPSSGGTCSASVPSEASSAVSTWEPKVTGNVAILGTAPALAGSQGTALITDAIAYAASAYNSQNQTGTGLYVSLNCEDSSDQAGSPVGGTGSAQNWLNGVEGIGTAGGLTDTGQGSACPAGAVNKQEAIAAAGFSGLPAALNGVSGWSLPACPVQESFNSWPGSFTPVVFDPSATPANFTASSGASGQPSVLLGTPAGQTPGLTPSQGGQVLPGTAPGGVNPAAPGVDQAMTADPVDTENGVFTQAWNDLSIPGFGPALDFSRTYDSALAQREAGSGTPVAAGQPGSLGYGWTDNWDTWLTARASVLPGYLYTIDGQASATGNQGPATSAAMNSPGSVSSANGNLYVADAKGNRIIEVPGSSGTQWGISMQAGYAYTVVGSDTGVPGGCANGTYMFSCDLNDPQGVTVDPAGDIFIADTGSNRILEVPAAGGTNYGVSMSGWHVYTVAGNAGGSAGDSGNGGLASNAYLKGPTQVVLGAGGDTSLYIADAGNNRVQEVFQAGGETWGRSMTNNDIYTIAGQSSGTGGNNGAGGPATSAYLSDPQSVAVSGSGDLYLAVTGNNKIQEVPEATGPQWGLGTLTANNIYNIIGVANGSPGQCSDGAQGPGNNNCLLDQPTGVVTGNNGQLYISDGHNVHVAELARTAHTEWGISMTAGYFYNIAGSGIGNAGHAGDGGAATHALLSNIDGAVAYTSSGIYIPDTGNNEIRFVSSSSPFDISDYAGGAGTFAQDGEGGTAAYAGLSSPAGVGFDVHGDVFIADASGNRVQEIAAWTHAQFGISMTAGDVYTVAGSPGGYGGYSGDKGNATSGRLNGPAAVAVDYSGNLYIADAGNNVIREVAAAAGTQWGQQMYAGDVYTIAGTGTAGNSGQGGPATSAQLSSPDGVATDTAGDVYLSANNQVLEIPVASGGTSYGVSMPTAGDIYTIAGSTAGTAGHSGDLGKGYSALLNEPAGLAVDASGNLFIGDQANNRVQELMAVTVHTQQGTTMWQQDIYTVAGKASGTGGSSGDGGPATAALLSAPAQVAVDSSGNLYIADSGNNRIREVAAASGPQWGQPMTGASIYTIAGTGSPGSPASGVLPTTAPLDAPAGVNVDPSGNVYATSAAAGGHTANRLQEITAGPVPLFATSPPAGTTWSTSGITITQPDGSQITFYPKNNGSCVAPYVAAGTGGYCTLPQYTGATLSYTSNNGGQYLYTPAPGDTTYTYNAGGALYSESDPAGETLTISYGTPAPGNGHCPTWAATCNTITAPVGSGGTARTLVIGYNTGGLVDVVTDPIGRQWAFTHGTGSGSSDLVKVTDPMGNITTFTYDSTSPNPLLQHDMLSVTSPNAQPGGPDAGDSTVNAYDNLGRVTRQTDPMGYVTTFNWCANNAAGDCMNASTGTGYATVTDPDGNTTVYGYHGGDLTSQANYTGGTALTSENDYAPDQTAPSGTGGTQLDKATADGNGDVTTYTYDSAGNPAVTTDPMGNRTTQQSTGLGLAACTSAAEASSACSQSSGPSPVTPGGVITPPSSAPLEGVTWTLYDNFGNELYTTTGVYQPGSNTSSYLQTSYQLFKGNSVTVNGNNITCTYSPPSASLPCATINANGVVTQVEYDPQGDLILSSSPDGDPGGELATTTHAYDGDGEQTSQTSPDGNLSGANVGNYTTITAYDADGEQTSVTEGAGSGHTVTPRATSYGYDANGNQTTVQDARGFTTSTTYNANGQATLVTDPDGNATLTCYDGAGNVTQTVPPVGVAANSLTAASCPASYPSGYGNRLTSDATTWTFDGNGQQTVMTTPAQAGQSGYETTTYTHDGAGNLLTTTAPSTVNGGPNQVTVDAYNDVGELTAQTSGYGTSAAATTSYCYDPNGNQTSAVYPDGNVSGTAACETSSPWVVSSSSYPTPASYQITSSYDSVGDLVSVTTPSTAAAASGATTSYTYDPNGNQLTVTDSSGVTATSTYTPADRIATISYSGSSAHSVSYSYDADGQQTAMSDAAGSSGYVSNPFGELTSVTNGAGRTVSYGYNADGNNTSIAYPLPSTATWATSNVVTLGYDNADRMTSVTGFNGNKITLTNNANGQNTSEALAGTGDSITASYDSTGGLSAIALKNASSTLQSFSYSDSPAGTILNETDTPSSPQSPAVYSYDTQSRLTSTTPGSGAQVSYGYDASGNLTTLPSRAVGSYDHAGELTSSVLNGTTTSYAYNADGQRLTAKQGSTTVASGTWNGAEELTAYSSPAGSMTAATYDANGLRASATTTSAQQFTWNPEAPGFPSLLMDSANAYVYIGNGAPAEQVNLATGAVSYLATDLLGSVRGIVDSSGALTGTTSYDTWGNPQTPGGLTASTPFGYAGGYTDPTGLLYLINRYYDPQTGQFTSVDPDLSQTLAPYAYASGNPVSDADPAGQITWFLNHNISYFNIDQVTVTSQTCYEIGGSFVVDGHIQYCHSKTSVHNHAKGHLSLYAEWAYSDGWTYLSQLHGKWADNEGTFINPFLFFFLEPEGRRHVLHRWFRDEQTGNHISHGDTHWFEAIRGRPHHPGILAINRKNPFLNLQLWALSLHNKWYRAAWVGLDLTTNGQ